MSSRERQQRAAARARQAVARETTLRRRRQPWVVAGSAVALLLLMSGVYWGYSVLTSERPSAAADGGCQWVEYFESHLEAAGAPAADRDPGAGSGGQAGDGGQGGELLAHPQPELMVDVGTPPTDVPRAGTRTMTVTTNLGEITVEMDLSLTPCTAAGFAHLAAAGFYDGTYCHRMFPGVLQCGDPNATDPGYRDADGIGAGGPTYEFPDEHLPATQDPTYYPAGTVAMANGGSPDTNGSQFFFVYRDVDLDGPNYSLVGRVTAGMEVFEVVDENGHDSAYANEAGGGHPNQDVIIERLRVSVPKLPEPSGSPRNSTTSSG